MKKVYIMIAAVTFVVGFVLGAVLILSKLTRRLGVCCDDCDMEELYRIDGANVRKDYTKKNHSKELTAECEEENQ